MQGDGTAMQHGLTGRRHGIVPGAASSTRRLLIGLGVLLAAASSAAAQQPSQAQANAIRQACRSDYQSHCAGVPTGGSAALSCLQQNATSLSQPCQQALAAVGGNARGQPWGQRWRQPGAAERAGIRHSLAGAHPGLRARERPGPSGCVRAHGAAADDAPRTDGHAARGLWA